MEENGGKWGGDGEIAVIAHGMWVVEGCGGICLREMGEDWEKKGTKWDKMGQNGTKWDKIPIFLGTILPIFPEVEDLPTVPFVTISSPHSPTEKWASLPLTDTHRHGGLCGYLET